MHDPVDLSIDARGVATLTLNRPEKHNALSGEMMEALITVCAQLAADRAVRVVVLTGAGESFCAGGDLAWMNAQFRAGGAQRDAAALLLARMLRALEQLPQPLIGRIQGNGFGGGVGLMSVCDAAIGVTGARFGLTETRLGLIPAVIGPFVVARMGAARARQVFMSSRVFDAGEAVRLDLLARAVPAQALDAAIEAELQDYLSCAPSAVHAAKAHLRDLTPGVDDQMLADSVAALMAHWAQPDAQEGIRAYFERRSPAWQEK